MTDTHSQPQSQPDDLVRRFEPARAVCAPKSCDRRKGCWVITAIPGPSGSGYVCNACKGYTQIPGNEAKHMAVLRRCMAAREVKP